MDVPAERPAYLSYAEARSVISGILLAMFLAALNQTIVATALPTIGRDLQDFENLSWTVTAYLLTSTVVASLYGKLSDIHGRRAMMLAAIGIFVAGSAVCALAPNMLTLVLGRGLQGLGGGGIMPLAQVIVGDVSPPRDRGRYQAYIGIVWVGAGVGGPVVGGFIAEHLAWPLIFWINVPLGIAAAWLTNAALKRLPRNDRWHELDIIGA
ncbi:MAG TPA: MFS transporter, partial [Xanthobacteraceae bacterium]|nr:MFS transporter [Xanthobacteraceae bacterium]